MIHKQKKCFLIKNDLTKKLNYFEKDMLETELHFINFQVVKFEFSTEKNKSE